MDEKEKDLLIKSMSEKLPVFRAHLKLSQEDLAELLGISRYTLIAIEKQQRKMSWNVFLSCLLIFTKNDEAKNMLKIMGIYTTELDNLLNLKTKLK